MVAAGLGRQHRLTPRFGQGLALLERAHECQFVGPLVKQHGGPLQDPGPGPEASRPPGSLGLDGGANGLGGRSGVAQRVLADRLIRTGGVVANRGSAGSVSAPVAADQVGADRRGGRHARQRSHRVPRRRRPDPQRTDGRFMGSALAGTRV